MLLGFDEQAMLRALSSIGRAIGVVEALVIAGSTGVSSLDMGAGVGAGWAAQARFGAVVVGLARGRDADVSEHVTAAVTRLSRGAVLVGQAVVVRAAHRGHASRIPIRGVARAATVTSGRAVRVGTALGLEQLGDGSVAGRSKVVAATGCTMHFGIWDASSGGCVDDAAVARPEEAIVARRGACAERGDHKQEEYSQDHVPGCAAEGGCPASVQEACVARRSSTSETRFAS